MSKRNIFHKLSIHLFRDYCGKKGEKKLFSRKSRIRLKKELEQKAKELGM